MAITQNLARLSEALLADCRASVEALDAVCSLRALDDADRLDLDWAPAMLCDVARVADMPVDLQQALRRATSGDGEVNPAYRNLPYSVFEHPVSSLTAADVAAVSASLDRLAERRFLDAGTVARAADGWRAAPEDAPAYLSTHFRALCDFYRTATTQGLAVILWQD